MLAMVIIPTSAIQSQTLWQAGTGDWFTAGNWTLGVPTAADDFQINNRGTAQILAAGALGDEGRLGVAALQSGTLQIGATGTLTSANFFVGDAGTGTLSISAGGILNAVSTSVGQAALSNGTATVSGTNSALNNSFSIFVGNGGMGNLTISAGGVVTVVNQSSVGNLAGGIGGATVTGANSTWNTTQGLYVGVSGSGTLNIANGGAATSLFGVMGDLATGFGSTTVTGVGSSWATSANFFVGNSGTGALLVENGGLVENTGIGYIGTFATGLGSVTVRGANAAWTNTNAVVVGFSGGANLAIESGGLVTNTVGVIAFANTSNGVAVVTGANSLWLNSGALAVGLSGQGLLRISNGGTVVTTNVSVGTNALSTGTIELDGTNGARGVLATAQVAAGAGTAMVDFDGGIFQASVNQTELLAGFAPGAVTLSGGGAFINSNAFNVGTAQALVGPGSLNKIGAGILTLSGASTYTGGTFIEQGTLLVVDGGDFNGSVFNNATLQVTRATPWIIDGAISGVGNYIQDGTSNTFFIAQNTYTGGTNILGGALYLQQNGSLVGNVLNNTQLINQRTTPWTYSGVMTGTGQFIQDGSSNTILAGQLQNTGGVRINSGSVQMVDNSAITGPIVNNALLNVNRTQDYTFNQVISGTGQFIQDGTSNTIFVAENTYTGPTTINNGKVTVNGSIAGLVNVNSAGTLGGGGVIGGDMNNSGIINPGNSPGLLTINGNLNLNSGGILQIEIDGFSLGQFDQLQVGGVATLSGTLFITLPNNLNLQNGQRVAFLQAGDGIEGTFDSINSNFPGALRFSVVIGAPGADFGANPITPTNPEIAEIVVAPIPYADFAFTPNQRAIANVLDAERFFNLGGPFAVFLNFWDTIPTGQLPFLLDQLAPTQISAGVRTTLNLGQNAQLRFSNRMSVLRWTGVQTLEAEYGAKDSPVMLEVDAKRFGLWFEGGGAFSDFGGIAGTRGYYIQSGVATAGLDYAVAPGLTLGLFAGYQGAETDIDGNGGEIEVNGGGGAAYLLYQNAPTGLFVQGMVGANANSYDTHRNFLLPGFGIASARGDTDGIEFNTNGAIGWQKSLGGLNLTAEAAVRYSYVELDSFNERGAFPFNVAYAKQTGESLQSILSLRANYPLKVAGRTLVPEVRAGWRHEFLNQDLVTNGRFTAGLGTPFGVATNGPGTDTADLGVGATYFFTDDVSLTLNYDAQLANRYTSHNVTALVRWMW